MAFKMKGSPAKTGGISGTAGHRSALKQMELSKKETKDAYGDHGGQDITFNPTGTEFTRDGKTIKVNPEGSTHKKLLEARWKSGDKASGNRLNELVTARKSHKKGTPEYNAIQNEINEALGSKVRRSTEVEGKGPKNTKKTEITKPGPDNEMGTDDDVTTTEDRVKGLQRKKGKTLTYAEKQAEGVKKEKAKTQIKEGKKEDDKLKKLRGKQELAEIKSGRDDEYTGTMWSRGVAKRKAKRLSKKIKKLEGKEKK
jgi:hypothetical protein